MNQISCWSSLELCLSNPESMTDPLLDFLATATFRSPQGEEVTLPGFWDGGDVWRVRFAPDVQGEWAYAATLTRPDGQILHSQTGGFLCTLPEGNSPFARHGPIRMAANQRHLEHADGAPFFWLADTAWNGPLRSTQEEWEHYLLQRQRQGFRAVQWVATQWRSAPDGDRDGNLAYTSGDQLTVNPTFFQRLEERMAATQAAGLLNAPVLLWANPGGDHPQINPGVGLPEDQAIALARYMVARWHAWPVLWILPGDARYEAEQGEKWRRIGRGVFGDGISQAPVAVHCVGQYLPMEQFRPESWLDVVGYQSGHGDSDATWQWLVTGPPAQAWRTEPRQFHMNLEPAYENHLSYHHKVPHSPFNVRKAIYWSLLNAPTAGVTYGGHGVWGWDDGTSAPVDHPNTGAPLPWQQALTMAGAEQIAHASTLFAAIPWWRLEPAPDLLQAQPGEMDVHKTILLSASPERDLILAYTPAGDAVHLQAADLNPNLSARWFDPRHGQWCKADQAGGSFAPPDDQDWVLALVSSGD